MIFRRRPLLILQLLFCASPLLAQDSFVTQTACILSGTITKCFLPVNVPSGGTGVATLASNGVLYGNGTGAVQAATAGTADQVLVTPHAGGAPTFGQLDLSQSAAVKSALGIANGGTGQGSKSSGFDALSPMVAAGDTIYGGTSGDGLRLVASTSNTVLHSGTTPSWSAVSLTADVTGVLPTGNMAGPAATGTSGYLSSTDWGTFNNKQARLANVCTIRQTNVASSLTCTSTCNAGETVTGGGCGNNLNTVICYQNFPSASNAWTCNMSLNTGTCSAYAICCTN